MFESIPFQLSRFLYLMTAIFSRKLLQATIRANKTGYFLWIGSDSWGAKVHPVKEQEFAAEGAITILPTKNAIQGNKICYLLLIKVLNKD